MNDLHRQAAAVALSLGIAVYIRDGRLYQNGPGERIDPPPNSNSPFHGSITTQAAAETAP